MKNWVKVFENKHVIIDKNELRKNKETKQTKKGYISLIKTFHLTFSDWTLLLRFLVYVFVCLLAFSNHCQVML